MQEQTATETEKHTGRQTGRETGGQAVREAGRKSAGLECALFIESLESQASPDIAEIAA